MSKNTVRDSLSVSLTVGAYGVAFGAASVASGFSVLQTCLFSLLTFTGASQFAAVGVVGSGGAAISAVAAATMLGTRNALYAIQMAPLLRVRGLRRVAAAHLTIDESTGVALSQAPRGTAAMRAGFWLTGSGGAPRRWATPRRGAATRRCPRRSSGSSGRDWRTPSCEWSRPRRWPSPW
jgi:predicted branched-subunit amino acid permease